MQALQSIYNRLGVKGILNLASLLYTIQFQSQKQMLIIMALYYQLRDFLLNVQHIQIVAIFYDRLKTTRPEYRNQSFKVAQSICSIIKDNLSVNSFYSIIEDITKSCFLAKAYNSSQANNKIDKAYNAYIRFLQDFLIIKNMFYTIKHSDIAQIKRYFNISII